MLEILPPLCHQSLAVKWQGKKLKRSHHQNYFFIFFFFSFQLRYIQYEYIFHVASRGCITIKRKKQVLVHFFHPRFISTFQFSRCIVFFFHDIFVPISLLSNSLSLTNAPIHIRAFRLFSFSFCLDLPTYAFLPPAPISPLFFRLVMKSRALCSEGKWDM